MAFNKRIIDKLDEACRGNEAMRGYMHDIVSYELSDTGRYKTDYETFLKKRAKEEAEESGE